MKSVILSCFFSFSVFLIKITFTFSLFNVAHILTRHVCAGRCERLEDQLNDLTELHQNETTNLKQELASIEEKVAYQAYERARDMQVHTRTHTAVCLSIEPG